MTQRRAGMAVFLETIQSVQPAWIPVLNLKFKENSRVCLKNIFTKDAPSNRDAPTRFVN